MIISTDNVCGGHPRIDGTRIEIFNIIGSLADGMSFEEIAETYQIKISDIEDALHWAREFIYSHFPNDDNKPEKDKPYLGITEISKKYNPNYGDSRVCECGHPYERHFDSYEDMYPTGCKYCGCSEFREKTEDSVNQGDECECNLDKDALNEFIKLHPMDKVHKMPTSSTDSIGRSAMIEVMGIQCRMICIDINDGISSWRRIDKIHPVE